MDYYLRFKLLEEGEDGGAGGYVAVVVRDVGLAVVDCAEVENGDCCRGVRKELLDDVVT